MEIFIVNRTDQILKNLNINFYSLMQQEEETKQKLLDKLKNPYLLPEESIVLYKTLQYDASKEFKFFAEISYQNNAGIIMGYITTNKISFNIIDFLEVSGIDPNQFRQIWLDCEWENMVNITTSKMTSSQLIERLQSQFKLTILHNLSIKTEKFISLSLYSKFTLGKDLLINASIEIDKEQLNAGFRLRSQNKGVVVLIANKLKKLSN